MGKGHAQVDDNAGSKLAEIYAGKGGYCLFGWLEESDVGLELAVTVAGDVTCRGDADAGW